MSRLAALRTRSCPQGAHTRLTKMRLTDVGSILQNAPHRGAIPVILAPWAFHALRLEPPAHFADGTTLQGDPAKYLPDHVRLEVVHFVACLAVAFVFAEVTVAVGRTAEHVDNTGPGRVSFATPAAFEDFRAF